MTTRFSAASRGEAYEIVFDDGGMNLLSSHAIDELTRVVEGIPIDVPVLLFRSGRFGLFAAGADMAEMREFHASEALKFSDEGQRLFRRIERLHQITVALIDGDCFGGALDLAMAFDLRFATPRSRFAHPGSRIGIVTGFGGTSRWRSVIPAREGSRIFLQNETLDAASAHDLGLVDRVVDGSDSEIDGVLQHLCGCDRRYVRFVKDLVLHAPNIPDSCLPTLSRALHDVYFAEDHDS